MTNLLTGKTAVITGANRGIGKSIVETFAENGANIIACVRVIDADIEKWIECISRKHKVSTTLVLLNLADTNSVKEFPKKILKISKKVDILVNNAGIASGGLFQMTTIEELKNVFNVNFFSQVLISQGISRIMSRNKIGSIVNISSTSAYIADPGTLVYGSSKSAFSRATKSMATELGSFGIRVNAVAPSITKTDMFDQMSKDAREKLIESSAVKRYAKPRDIANVALFLASDLSSYVNGQVIRVDGGIV